MGASPHTPGVFDKRRNMRAGEPGRIRALIEAEVEAYDSGSRGARMKLEDFRAALREPSGVTVNFSGGLTQKFWAGTRANGAYRVI